MILRPQRSKVSPNTLHRTGLISIHPTTELFNLSCTYDKSSLPTKKKSMIFHIQLQKNSFHLFH